MYPLDFDGRQESYTTITTITAPYKYLTKQTYKAMTNSRIYFNINIKKLPVRVPSKFLESELY